MQPWGIGARITVPLLATTAVDLTDSEFEGGKLRRIHRPRHRRALRRSWLRRQLKGLGLTTKAAVFPDIHTLHECSRPLYNRRCETHSGAVSPRPEEAARARCVTEVLRCS